MKNTFFSIVVVTLLLAVGACKSKKTVTDGGHAELEEDASKEMTAMLRKVRETQVPYTWFAASGQGKIDWDGQRLSAKVNVRILRDSIIWVQIQKLGFEVGRMKITPDSAFFINRFERSYAVGRTEDFLREYNVPADFHMFSMVFTAGAYLPPVIQSSLLESDGSVSFHSNTGIQARHWFDPASLLIRSLITDPMTREWYSVYSNYQYTSSGERFPFKRSNSLMIDGEANIFDLEYSEVSIDVPQEFPFSIPSHYEKI